MGIVDEYIALSKEYTVKYGERTVVLFEVGNFYEWYGVLGEGADVQAICDLLNVQATHKDKSKPPSVANPALGGIPKIALQKYLPVLVDDDRTVVLALQHHHPNGSITRRVSEVFSKGTSISVASTAEGAANNIMAVYVEGCEDTLCIGVAAVDLSTARSFVGEISGPHSLEELHRMVTVLTPKEVVVCHSSPSVDMDSLIVHAGLPPMVHVRNEPKLCHATYQNAFLQKVFPSTGLLSPAEYLDIERDHYAIPAFVAVLQFAYDHNERIITRISRPNRLDDASTTIVSFNALHQLDIVHPNGLLTLLNRCVTPMGRRLFRERVVSPVFDRGALNERYDRISELIVEERYSQVNAHLQSVGDLERTWRKFSLGRMMPSEIATMHDRVLAAQECLQMEATHANEDHERCLDSLARAITSTIDLKLACNCSNTQFNTSFFVRGTSPEIDAMVDAITQENSGIVGVKNTLNELAGAEHFRIETSTDGDSVYLVSTAKRWSVVKPKTTDMGLSAVPITSNSAYVRIRSKNLDEFHSRIATIQTQLQAKVRDLYESIVRQVTAAHGDAVQKAIEKVKELDVACACAHNAVTQCHVRPSIIDAATSQVTVTKLRHPIIENMQNSRTLYVPNDVTLGGSTRGMLLYGVNASGKSSLMKAVGISVVLAQAGMFVPCATMELCPFRSVFTRVGLKDDLTKGHSTFMVEMLELRNILRRADSRSLVIGDELCAGTENTSALAIVGAGVASLHEKRSAYMFATHLHELTDLRPLSGLEGMAVKHMGCKYDPSVDGDVKLVYERTLREGRGLAVYGLEVCKGLDMPEGFLKVADSIRREIQGVPAQVLSKKTSRYNGSLYMDACSVCGKRAEHTHHIQFQSAADVKGMIDGRFHKNNLRNLVALCAGCHASVHDNKISINGYVSTTHGVHLDVDKTGNQRDPVRAPARHGDPYGSR